MSIPDQFCIALPWVKRSYVQYITYWVDVPNKVIVSSSSGCGYYDSDAGGLQLRSELQRSIGTYDWGSCTIARKYSIKGVENRQIMDRWEQSYSQLKAHQKAFVSNGQTRAVFDAIVGPLHPSTACIVFPEKTQIRFTPVNCDYFTGQLCMPWDSASGIRGQLRTILLENRDSLSEWCSPNGSAWRFIGEESTWIKMAAELHAIFKGMSLTQCVYVNSGANRYTRKKGVSRIAARVKDAMSFAFHPEDETQFNAFFNIPNKAPAKEARATLIQCITRHIRRNPMASTATRNILALLAAGASIKACFMKSEPSTV